MTLIIVCSRKMWKYFLNTNYFYIHVDNRQIYIYISLSLSQSLYLRQGAGGIQGVTELRQCERTQDQWLQELQAELRIGNLSKNNHDFLHGRPMIVPGSWLEAHGRPTCSTMSCQQLQLQNISSTTIMHKECPTC